MRERDREKGKVQSRPALGQRGPSSRATSTRRHIRDMYQFIPYVSLSDTRPKSLGGSARETWTSRIAFLQAMEGAKQAVPEYGWHAAVGEGRLKAALE